MHAPAAMCEAPYACHAPIPCHSHLYFGPRGWAWWWLEECCWLTSVVTCHHVVSNVEAQFEVPGTVAQVYLVLKDVHAVVHVLVAAQ